MPGVLLPGPTAPTPAAGVLAAGAPVTDAVVTDAVVDMVVDSSPAGFLAAGPTGSRLAVGPGSPSVPIGLFWLLEPGAEMCRSAQAETCGDP